MSFEIILNDLISKSYESWNFICYLAALKINAAHLQQCIVCGSDLRIKPSQIADDER
jgi:hypothetical protein